MGVAEPGNGWRPNRAQERVFRRERKVYRIDFEAGHELHGLVARVGSVPLGTLLDLMEAAQGLDLDRLGDVRQIPVEAAGAVKALLQHFGDALVDWNLQDEDGTPVPATYEGLVAQDLEVVMPVIDAWMTAVAGVTAPLGPTSSGGDPSLEVSLPMVPSSPSPSN